MSVLIWFLSELSFDYHFAYATVRRSEILFVPLLHHLEFLLVCCAISRTASSGHTCKCRVIYGHFKGLCVLMITLAYETSFGPSLDLLASVGVAGRLELMRVQESSAFCMRNAGSRESDDYIFSALSMCNRVLATKRGCSDAQTVPAYSALVQQTVDHLTIGGAKFAR